MAKPKVYVTKNASDLADLLGLSPADGLEIAVKAELNAKIIDVVNKRELTHTQVVKALGDITNARDRHYESQHKGDLDRSLFANFGIIIFHRSSPRRVSLNFTKTPGNRP